MAERITLSTIADKLGVSTATVSLALRDSPLVAEATRERIKEQAREIGYIYNRRAASLRTSRSDIVGVLVRDIVNPFFAEILRSIEKELGDKRQTFLLCNHDDNLEIQENFIATLMQFGADGVIMSPSVGTTPQDVERIEKNGIPVTMIARTVEGTDIPSFIGDDLKGMELVTSHLLDLGHRDIAIVGGTTLTSTGRARRAGFEAAFKKLGLPAKALIDIETPYDKSSGYEAAKTILKAEKLPTAVACCSDTVAIGVMNGLREAGLIAGKDISVTGYDDIEEARIAAPPLTSVSDGHNEIGRQAAQALIAKINGDTSFSSINVVPPELRSRSSVCPPQS
ncbi:MAG: LacI family DNA-binding transcriptional regulator [Pseudomonadota bacterium]